MTIMPINDQLLAERNHYRRRAEELALELNAKYEIIKAAAEWYHAWKGKSLTRMRDANLGLRKVVEDYLEE